MSSFICEHCGAYIIDTEDGYTTECEHYPLEKGTTNAYSKTDNKKDCNSGQQDHQIKARKSEVGR